MVKMTEIDGPGKKAKFIGIGEDNKDKEYEVEFDMIHVTPRKVLLILLNRVH